MDVAAWVAEGTVDTIIPYTMAPEPRQPQEAWPDPTAADPWIDLVRGTATKLSLSIMPRWKSPDDYRRTAQALYARGAESLFFWDCGGQRVNFMDQFAWNASAPRASRRGAGLAGPGAAEPDPDEIPHITLLAIPVGRPGPEVASRPALEIGGYDLGFEPLDREGVVVADPIILADMDRCLPASGLSRSPRRGAWRLVPFRVDAFGGTMLVAANETNAPEVRYPLEVSGWHRISIGAFTRSAGTRSGASRSGCRGIAPSRVLSVPSGPLWQSSGTSTGRRPT